MSFTEECSNFTSIVTKYSVLIFLINSLNKLYREWDCSFFFSFRFVWTNP